MGIPAAGIRQDKHRAVGQGLVLQSEADSSGLVVWKQRAIDRDTKEGHEVRLVASDLSFQGHHALSILNRVEDIDPSAAAADDIGEAESPIRQAPIVLVRQWLRYEFRIEQEFPETVGVTGEVMSGGC